MAHRLGHLNDLSSGFRLYKAVVIGGQEYAALDCDILQRILVQAYAQGWRIREVPFAYEPSRRSAPVAVCVAHYTLDELRAIFARRGYTLEDARYILKGELIMALREPMT